MKPMAAGRISIFSAFPIPILASMTSSGCTFRYPVSTDDSLATEDNWLSIGAAHKNQFSSGSAYIYYLSSSSPTVPTGPVGNRRLIE